MQFLDMTKEAAFIIGSLQNDSITGLNSDDQSYIKESINEEVRYLLDMHPPFANSEWNIELQTSVTLEASGTAGIPVLSNAGKDLTKRDIYRSITDDSEYHRVIDISGTTVTLDSPLKSDCATTHSWTAYKDVMPLPANLGDIEKIYYEDDYRDVYLCESREEFAHISENRSSQGYPLTACANAFTDRFGEYKIYDSAVTCVQDSRQIVVPSTTHYDTGDVVQLDTGTTDNFVYTVTGIDSSTTNRIIYFDRAFTGPSGSHEAYVNPRKHTEYISFYDMPDENNVLRINGWVKPYDMVMDTDECILPEDLCSAAIIGALERIDWYSEFISERWLAHRQKVLKKFKSRKKSQKKTGRRSMWGRRDYMANDFDFPG